MIYRGGEEEEATMVVALGQSPVYEYLEKVGGGGWWFIIHWWRNNIWWCDCSTISGDASMPSLSTGGTQINMVEMAMPNYII